MSPENLSELDHKKRIKNLLAEVGDRAAEGAPSEEAEQVRRRVAVGALQRRLNQAHNDELLIEAAIDNRDL